jgi:hypothetical protein
MSLACEVKRAFQEGESKTMVRDSNMSEAERADDRLPLHLALAWIASRDADVVFEMTKRAQAGFKTAWEYLNSLAAHSEQGNPATDAWLQLSDAIANSRVHATADPFNSRNRQPVHLVWTTGEDFDVEGESDGSEELSKEVNSLVLEPGKRQIELRPKEAAFQPDAWWWTNVRVCKSELLSHFPEKSIKKTEQSVRPRDHKRRLVREIIQEAYPKGLQNGPGETVVQRTIDAKCRELGWPTIHISTIRRAIKDCK